MPDAASPHNPCVDPLTGLMSRHAISGLLRTQLAAPDGADVSALLVDLDGFGLLNDITGHSSGDTVLATLGKRLATLGTPGCHVGRLGSDEFLVTLVGAGPRQVEDMAATLLRMVREPLVVGGRELTLSASIGLATLGAGAGVDDLLRHADLALREAKAAGRDRAMWFGEEQDAALAQRAQRVTLARDLRSALNGPQLQLYYQPAFDLRTGAVIGVEALLRWDHPAHGMLAAGDVVAMAEETGLIEPLGTWVIRTAMDQAASWTAIEGFTVWVNVSPRQLAQEGLAEILRQELERVRLPPHRFGIEVTESALGDHETAATELSRVEALGVQIAVDDFGTGYSSLARLVRFPVDVIKIDRSFVSALGSGTGDAVVTGIVTLAKGLGADVIAEGVETRQQLRRLQSTGCDAAAGFLLARPLPVGSVDLASAGWPRGEVLTWSDSGVPTQRSAGAVAV